MARFLPSTPSPPMNALTAGGPPHVSRAGSATDLAVRVPPVDAVFWIVKLPAVTIGTTIADRMAGPLGLGTLTTSWILGAVLAGALMLQLAQRRYVPWTYWSTATLVGVAGTLLVTDLLEHGAGLAACALALAGAFGVALGATFAAWHALEGSVSMRSIVTARREGFHWLAIGLAYALGEAGGELVAGALGIGHLGVAVAFGAVIAAVACTRALRLAAVHRRLLDGVRAVVPGRRLDRRAALATPGRRRPGPRDRPSRACCAST